MRRTSSYYVAVSSIVGATLIACGNAPDVDVTQQAIGKSVRVRQTPLLGANIPKYVDALPTFAGKRVNGAQSVTLDMREFQQKILPASVYSSLAAPYSAGTYLWGYKVNTSGPSWPATTIEARRSTATTVILVNNLKQADGSPPVLAKYLTVDQTIHWADPLNTTHRNMCMDGPPYAAPCLLPYVGPIPAVVHLHGAEVWSGYDGGPDTWFTPGAAIKGPGFVSNTFNYVNTQEATTMWFHDHALGMTRINVYSGLGGFYLLRDTRDTGLATNPIHLPAAQYEQEMLIADRQFDTQGQLILPDGTPTSNPTGLNGPPPNPDVHPYWNPEFFGDVITVNGKSWPYFRVEPRRYRLRFVNGSNARFLQMRLVNQASQQAGPAIWQIGTDGGLLDAPVKLADPASPTALPLFLAPAERADVIVDFAGQSGKTFILTNGAAGPYPSGDPPDPSTTAQVMQFRVNVTLSGTDTSYNPAAPTAGLRSSPIVRLDPAVSGKAADVKRQLVLKEVEGDGGPLEVLLNNAKWSGIREGSNPAQALPGSVANHGVYSSENPRVGSTEIWEITNLTEDAHPIHLHLIQFQIINRQSLDSDSYNLTWEAAFPGGTYGGIAYAPGTAIPGFGPPRSYNTLNTAGAIGGNPDITPFLQGSVIAPDPNEKGWKDTIKVYPHMVTRIVARWAPQGTSVGGVSAGTNLFAFDPTTGPGYVWHCHILDHEDNEMMRPYLVAK